MKTVEKSQHARPVAAASPPTPARLTSLKILPRHHDKLAIVYVRQSSPQQVLENRESTARQYALAGHAQALGWSADRVLIIDEDQGQSGRSVEHRTGFQRLLSEVTTDHVGIVLGLEMSRLSRSSKDWHHLLEVCGIFGTLLADQDGVYDAGDPNDRLLLGLKGTISEVELHTMRNRLIRGRDNKAARGEMFHGVPMGYVLLPSGAVALEPDQQARGMVQLIFSKFEELGSIYGVFHWLIQQDVRLPVRLRSGIRKGELDWRRPSIATLAQMLRHPIYAGAYVYGRRRIDPKRRLSAKPGYRPWVSMEQWKVLLPGHLPAYISWDQYLQNRERIKQNQHGPDTSGAPRAGLALLPGLLVCGNCGRHMQASYHGNGKAQYSCNRQYVEGTEPRCYGLAAHPLDDLVTRQLLRALTPAALELSMQAHADIEAGRQRLDQLWQQRRQRSNYETQLAQRRYQAVDPANRLVAATLEKQWEDLLNQTRQLQDDYDRFVMHTPPRLTETEREHIAALASDIPRLWQSPGTTNVDRKQIVRCLVEKVVVQVRCDSERVEASIHWAGGYESRHEVIRPVATYAQLRDFEPLMQRIAELRACRHTAPEIAQKLNAEGFYPPKRCGCFTTPVVHQLLKRRGLIGNERQHDELLGEHEWWLADLAAELPMSHLKLRDWAHRGWVHSRRTPVQRYWILWADDDEVQRLRNLLAQSRRGVNVYSSISKTPKQRPTAT